MQTLQDVKRYIVEIEKFKKEISIKRNVPTIKSYLKRAQTKDLKNLRNLKASLTEPNINKKA